MVAATAITERIPLVTHDRDYDSIAGLDVLHV
jgi:predicted nucleic acid-binding protein